MTDNLLRQRYIAAGLIRPNTKELDPIQLNPGAIVFRIQSDEEFMSAFRADLACAAAVMKGANLSCWH